MSQYPPDSFSPEPAQPDPYGSSRQAASGKAVPAGICLFIVGLVNLVLPGYVLVVAVNVANATPEQAEAIQAQQLEMTRRLFPQQAADLEKDQTPPLEKLRKYLVFYIILSGVTGLGCLLTMIGGWRMWSLRNYGLALTGAIVTAIPCISCTACCGVGEGVGIWALVVLLNPDVRAAFR